MTQTELDRERAYTAALYERLDALRADAETRLTQVREQNPGSNHQLRSERDAFARLYEDRLVQLREVDARLVFGRLQVELPEGGASDADGDDTDSDDSDAADDLRYIGRIGLRDDEQRSLLLDWRAPQASPFYQATAAHPQEVRARRHLTMREREVLRVDDEVFDDRLIEAGEQVHGEGALMAALTAQRTGHMHDIVATIQAEQDRIIRSELRGALVVQGGPGTGKTAVAIHRAAYLLYSHREQLRSSGVLIVGPSTAFLSYIDAVLPSLGETGVVLSTVGGLFPGVAASEDDEAQTAMLKGSLAMAPVISRAVRSRQRVPASPQTVDVNGEALVIEPALIARAIGAARETRLPHNEARVTFVQRALSELSRLLAEQLRAKGAALDDSDLGALREDLRTADDVKVVLNTAWLPLTAEKVLRDLYARPEWLAELTPGWSDETRALLARDRTAAFTVSDVPLLDEAAELLGEFPQQADAGAGERERQRHRDIENAEMAIQNMGVEGQVNAEQLALGFAESPDRSTTAERAVADRSWTYGHIVVDEAQELSPMQWRLLVRRCPMRSFTIVGDIAQVGSAAGASNWRSALQPFFDTRWRLEELTVNYRTPAQIAEEAEVLARANRLHITPAQSVRRGDWPVREVTAQSTAALPAAVTDAVAADREIDAGGTLAVICALRHVDAVAAALASRFGAEVGRGGDGLTRAIAVLTAREAKGLEFDAVVVVDPDALVAESPRGAGALYVAMTRPTQRLTMLRVG
ncbi:HelD family protein [Leifsonia sp. Root112D2]|uniref:HelD family protein n=1 Tax=Leifsonia sp. Root112D2 TaxID=1736426 RepID=UPI000701071A|nr:UvrD-helicase domain-containing protein [Leifsonia sp. Root112D2]KQV07126.1 AAA family ATPase [Leifsonia sp. Root112D2]